MAEPETSTPPPEGGDDNFNDTNLSDESTKQPETVTPTETADVPEKAVDTPKQKDSSPYDDDIRQPKKGWKRWLIPLVVVLLVGGGVALWFFVINSEEAVAPTEESANEQQTDQTVRPSTQAVLGDVTLEQIVYAFGEDFSEPGSIFSRPVTGGDRTDLLNVDMLSDVGFGNFADNLVALSTGYAFTLNENELWFAASNVAPQQIYTLEQTGAFSAQIVSPVVSPNGSQVAFATFTSTESGTEDAIWVVNSDGSNPRMITENTQQQPVQWSNDQTKLVLTRLSTVGTDAPLPAPQVLDINSGEASEAFNVDQPLEIYDWAISPDGTRVAYITSTVDQNRPPTENSTQSFYVGEPFTLLWRDMTNGQETEVATLEGDVGPSALMWLYNTNNQQFVYGVDSKLFLHNTADSQTIETYDTTSDDIDVVYAATPDKVLYGSQQPDSGFGIYTVDLNVKDRVKIMETTAATYAIGVVVKEK